ncbi:hypothetical protein HOLleu_43713 [Holothuria leucospilota]|uniref:Uncharacterized protein n=1 Tax=Holothuria leucospilota TaxID=206669 RepID=A0A9Q0YGN5_HOLLE|nr:hypothetical protein HOLleu_43713 [Holothuria leucospilota]
MASFMQHHRYYMDPKWTVLLIACARAFFTTGSVKVSGVFLGEMTHKLNTTNWVVAWAFSLQNGISLMIVCKSHFNVAAVVILISSGVGEQFGGFYAGISNWH